MQILEDGKDIVRFECKDKNRFIKIAPENSVLIFFGDSYLSNEIKFVQSLENYLKPAYGKFSRINILILTKQAFAPKILKVIVLYSNPYVEG